MIRNILRQGGSSLEVTVRCVPLASAQGAREAGRMARRTREIWRNRDPAARPQRKEFVGDEEHGANLAGLYSLVASCDAMGVDPIEYIKDVLMRVDTHPASGIDELLPSNWQPCATC